MQDPLSEIIKLYRDSKFDEALEELLDADGTALAYEDVAYYLGLCYTRLERYDDALLFLEQVVTAGSNPERRNQCRLALAYVYAVTGRNRLAEFELSQLAGSGEKTVQVYAALGYAAYSQGKINESLDYYQKALEIDPENPNALNSFGYILAEENLDLKLALTFCRKAVDGRPNNPAYLDSLGWTYFKIGSVAEAKSLLERAFVSAPDVKIIREHLEEAKRERLP
jgi:tetratricopeptide (TPR) repeat protein